jgi:hypothetical protein
MWTAEGLLLRTLATGLWLVDPLILDFHSDHDKFLNLLKALEHYAKSMSKQFATFRRILVLSLQSWVRDSSLNA